MCSSFSKTDSYRSPGERVRRNHRDAHTGTVFHLNIAGARGEEGVAKGCQEPPLGRSRESRLCQWAYVSDPRYLGSEGISYQAPRQDRRSSRTAANLRLNDPNAADRQNIVRRGEAGPLSRCAFSFKLFLLLEREFSPLAFRVFLPDCHVKLATRPLFLGRGATLDPAVPPHCLTVVF